ncbi:MAG: hypothetical protein AAB410_03675, partial [Patescibacteria group bacterium]
GYEAPHKIRLVSYLIGPEEPSVTDRYYLTDLSNSHFITSALDIRQPADWQPTKTPVLIVPGIMGTQIFKETELLWPDVIRMLNPVTPDDFMDPLSFNADGTPLDTSLRIGEIIEEAGTLDYTKKLREELVSLDYIEGQNLFTFPYDWRKNLDEIAQINLKGQIDYILNQTASGISAGKVDVIAHSQGGLVVKRLLKHLPEYETKINKLVFVGVPNLGAPKAAKVLLYGDNMDIAFAGMGLDAREVKKISQNMPSIYQLLPSAEYFNHTNGYLGIAQSLNNNQPILHVNTLNYNDTVQYLKNQSLNSYLIDEAETFHDSSYDNFDFSNSPITAYNIVGCQTGTIGKILLKPDGHFQIFPKPGDGTVPIFSANHIPGAQTFFALESSHGSMLTQEGIRQQILTIITGNALDTQGKITPFISDCHFNGTKVSSHSPVNMHIYDSLGNHVGPTPDGGFDSEIPNASYDVIGHENFAFLPERGQYTIKLIATGAGQFSFDSSEILEGEITNTSYYHAINIEPNSIVEIILNENNDQNILLDINGDTITDSIIAPSSILNASQSQDFTPPVSISTLAGTLGQPGFYRSNINITLSAFDPVLEEAPEQTSGVLKIEHNLDNAGWQTYVNPLSVVSEGQHSIQFYAVDNAGNEEQEQTVSFTIDKTP